MTIFAALLACTPTPAEAEQPTPAPVVTPEPPPPPLPRPPAVYPEKTSGVFVVRPVPGLTDLCKVYEETARPRPPVHDASHYPERVSIAFDILDVVRPNTGLGLRHSDPLQPSIAFASGPRAFSYAEPANAYDCKVLEQLLEHPYLVIATFPIHVDHGNHPSSPWDLGTDASMPNAGFSNRYEAKSWAESLRPAE